MDGFGSESTHHVEKPITSMQPARLAEDSDNILPAVIADVPKRKSTKKKKKVIRKKKKNVGGVEVDVDDEDENYADQIDAIDKMSDDV